MADSYIFQRVAKQARNQGINELSPAQARQWFREMAVSIQHVSVPRVKAAAEPFQNIVDLSENSIGKMYMFSYDPKWKDTLPYYDVFPIIFPIEWYGDSMLGINLHYLSPFYRAKLMDALWTIINNDKQDKTTKLQVSYRTLKEAAKFRLFKPCVHKYLFSHVTSPFMYIPPKMWDFSCLLPMARFKKKSQDAVWFESLLKAE